MNNKVFDFIFGIIDTHYKIEINREKEFMKLWDSCQNYSDKNGHIYKFHDEFNQIFFILECEPSNKLYCSEALEYYYNDTYKMKYKNVKDFFIKTLFKNKIYVDKIVFSNTSALNTSFLQVVNPKQLN